MGPEKYRD
jgi:hypothetical protein